MSSFYLKTVLFVVMISSSFPLFSQSDILDDISNAIRSGNSKEVARFFDSNVEITILDKEAAYSKVQAEMVLRDFFSKNNVQSFDLMHRGTSGEGSSYGIGTLKTSNQSYRTYYYVKQKGGGKFVQELRFEKQR